MVERLWGSATLPPGVEGYVRIARHGGRTLALIITADSLTPDRRAEVRRDLLAQALRKVGAQPSDEPCPPLDRT
ncbi:hypothetical protein ACG83_10980 [Frankia sp. R43]|nr:hypothetical protein ACG83_10980 [Frankia sp. R43]